MHDLPFFQKLIGEEIQKIQFPNDPADLYDPVRYMLNLGGKRIRPSLVLMSCEMFGGDYHNALFPALGIEVFHNFTLLHDDIMDKAPLRRSKQTVHTKWNADVAILAGDAMFVQACQLMIQTDKNVSGQVMNDFLETALFVCEGQQWDMSFQTTENVTISDYLKMIGLKTAVLLASSLKTGAVIAGALKEDAEHIYEFGKNLGISFQLHDDLLDVYADGDKFGKQAGGDIIANKKTFLLLKALELSTASQREDLIHWITIKEFEGNKKVEAIKNIFQVLNIKTIVEAEINQFFNAAMNSIEKIQIAQQNKAGLINLAKALMKREF